MRDFKAFAWDIQNPVPRGIWVCDKFTAICLNLSQFITNFFLTILFLPYFLCRGTVFLGLTLVPPFIFG